jgi:hypothetical protein
MKTPVQFAKGLSDSFQETRSATLDDLIKWMESSGSSHSFNDKELDQLWRALLYSFWMSDKRPVQQRMAVQAVLLIRNLTDEDMVVEWDRAFWFNLKLIYKNIDKYRIPKFQMFIRIYLAEFFHTIIKLDFNNLSKFISNLISNCLEIPTVYISILNLAIDELSGLIPLGDIKISQFKQIIEIGLICLKKSNCLPESVIKKSCDHFLSDPRVVSHSNKVRDHIIEALNTAGMDKGLEDQSIREVIFSTIEKIQEIPKKKKSRKSE